MKGQGSRTQRGCLGIWQPGPSLLVFAMRGQGDAAFVVPLLAAYERLAPASSIHLFAEVGSLSKYDSQLRTGLTARFIADRARFANFHVLVGSKLVGMGVAVANLAFGGKITTHANETTFHAALDKVLFDLRIVGFSSQALGSLALRPTGSASGNDF